MNKIGLELLKFFYIMVEVIFSVFLITFTPFLYGIIVVPLVFASMVSASGLSLNAGWEDKIMLWVAPSAIISFIGACLLVIVIIKAFKWSLVVYKNKLTKLTERRKTEKGK